ncbi:MmgE/PrpD family protein [Phytohabitans flavus]
MLTIERFAAELYAFAGSVTGAERAAARTCLADALACAAAGVGTPAHASAAAAMGDLDRGGDTQPVTVWFSGTRTGVLAAAYLNSVAVSAHDLDDGHRGAIGHPGGAVMPAVLAELELTGSTVDPLEAVAVGYEAALRIAQARDPARFERTATGRWGSYAAAAASWFVHGDPPATLAHALAHAGSLAPQLAPPDPRAVDGIKEGTPWAVVAGLMAARLARARVPGPLYLLEREDAYGPGDLDRIAARHPGTVTESYFKRYACCRWIHPVLDRLADMYPGAP